MNNLDNQPLYMWVMDDSTGTVTKTEMASGRTWTWTPKPRPSKAKCSPKNGVSIQAIAEAGHKVRVRHLRWAYYLGTNERTQMLRSNREKRVYNYRPIVVPSSFRRDPLYVLLPKGGYTHITIKTKENKYICLSSECATNDPFCYTTGVEKALERMTRDEVRYLGI
jgi:hypothetical protein